MLLPRPEGPTIAVDSPAGIEKDKSVKRNFFSSKTVGYLNETLWNLIDSLSVNPLIELYSSVTGLICQLLIFLSMTSKIIFK